jgi:nitroimidazol reductase NimA-like FMN-containing flavoprotein (pyridoxamine 5'-phosphate oxidase superfamily)
MTEQQRRGRRIAMSSDEVDTFLAEERTCRVATARPGRGPHVTPLWFVWDGTSIWLNSIVSSQRWADIAVAPQVSVLIDAGEDYAQLRGVELTGQAVPVGEVPRAGEDVASLAVPEHLWSEKYRGGQGMIYDGHHGWLCVTPERVVSWDFRKRA